MTKKSQKSRSTQRALKGQSFHPSVPGSEYAWMNGSTVSKETVNPDTAETISSVYNACTIISSSVGKLPLLIYKRMKNGGKQRESAHPVYRLFHRLPNRYLTPIELKEMIVRHLLLRGNFYAEKVLLKNGGWELVPLHPDYVQVDITSDGELRYRYRQLAKDELIPLERMFHVKGLGSNGKVGMSVISYARESLARVMAMDRQASEFFANASTPAGILKYPLALSQESSGRIRDDWQRLYGTPGNRSKVAVLEQGMEFQAVSINNTDSQFLESRKFEIEEVARWFNLPPHKLKHLDNATFSNIEHQGKEFWEDTILPWTIRIQQSIDQCFFSEEQNDERFAEFLYDSLLLTDTKTRYEAHNIALNGGWKTRNEIRITENLNPEDGLDEFIHNLGMGNSQSGGGDEPAAPKSDSSGDGGAKQSDSGAQVDDVADDANQDDRSVAILSSFKPVVSEHLERIVTKESKSVISALKTSEPTKKLESVYADFDQHCVKVLERLCRAVCIAVGKPFSESRLKAWASFYKATSSGELTGALLKPEGRTEAEKIAQNWVANRAEREVEGLLSMIIGGLDGTEKDRGSARG